MSNSFAFPTQFSIGKIEIDGIGVEGLFQSISIYENINSPTITGSIVMIDSDGANLIEKEEIEGVEEFEFEFKNSQDETINFKGYLNGLRNRSINNSKIMYVFDFHSKAIRKNEGEFVLKRFDNVKPEDVAKEMTERLEGQVDDEYFIGTGQPINFLGSRKRPTKVMEYVLQHGVTNNTSEASHSEGEQEGTTKGTTGFMWWETSKGYRFCSVDDVLEGKGGKEHKDYRRQLQNKNLSMEETMKGIIDYDFSVAGDIQSKMRGGAFKNTNISFDIDKGEYIEFKYDDESILTDKQKEAVPKTTRYTFRAFSNERFEDGCTKAEENAWDKSKLSLSQSIVRHNTFNDQTGHITLPPHFEINAGDTIEIKIPKVKSEFEGGYDKKHTGRYVIGQVGHHFFSDGRSYTKLSTVRSNTQQDDSSSTKNKK